MRKDRTITWEREQALRNIERNEHTSDVWKQTFRNGAMLIYDKRLDRLTLLDASGRTERVEERPTIEVMASMQVAANFLPGKAAAAATA